MSKPSLQQDFVVSRPRAAAERHEGHPTRPCDQSPWCLQPEKCCRSETQTKVLHDWGEHIPGHGHARSSAKRARALLFHAHVRKQVQTWSGVRTLSRLLLLSLAMDNDCLLMDATLTLADPGKQLRTPHMFQVNSSLVEPMVHQC